MTVDKSKTVISWSRGDATIHACTETDLHNNNIVQCLYYWNNNKDAIYNNYVFDNKHYNTIRLFQVKQAAAAGS